MKQGLTLPPTPSCCPTCSHDLIGNFSFGRSPLAESLYHWWLFLSTPLSVALALVALSIPYDTTPYKAGLMIPGIIIITVCTSLFLISLIPKTTVLTCHHCGHKKESIGHTVICPLVSHAEKVEAPSVEVQPIEPVKLEVTQIGSTQTEQELYTSDRRKRNSSRFDFFGSEPLSRNFARRW